MAINDHALRAETISAELSQILYSNERVEGFFGNAKDALDYIFNALYPNYIATVDTPAGLPATANNGDYYLVRDDGDGKSAGYIYETRDGTSAWFKKFDVDWSLDGILADVRGQIDPEYATLLGKEGGQIIAGGRGTGENLELEANSFDDTGEIIVHSDLVPSVDQGENLGSSAKAFLDVYIKGVLADGVNTISVAEALAAYQHSLITSGNPHSVSYDELTTKLGSLDLSGDITAVSVDLSTSGNKTATITVTDDSHNHTTATITDFDSATWALLKSRLVDTSNVNWTFDDVNFQAIADVTVDTSDITDIAAPAVNSLLAGNSLGDAWEAIDGTVELTGDVTGTGSYDSTAKKTSVAATVANVAIENIDRIDVSNLAVSVSAANPAVVTLASHGMLSGRNIRLIGTASLDGLYTITKINDDSFSIPVDNSLGVVEYGHVIPEGSQFLYDSTNNTWKVRLENAELSHHELSNLSGDDHAQYHNINGRGDGTTNLITGGELAGANLILRSTSDATRGSILFRDQVAPETGATYANGAWSGTDLGSSGRPFRDIHTRGEFKGGRAEQVGALPTPTATEVGRIVHLTTDGLLYWNKDGTVYEAIGAGTASDSDPVVTSVNFGDPTLDGTWRMTTSGTSFVIQVRKSGAWVTKDELQP